MNQFEERNIQITQFIASRAEEIKQLTSALESKMLNSNKIPYQILDKHLRRRAMSHNRYRIPASLRKKMNQNQLIEQENQQRVIRCRKHIRRAKLLQQTYMRRNRTIQWLETHLHQCKRMHMIDYFGFKVAEKAIEKNWRAVHRYETHGSCIYEMSYYLIFETSLDNLELFSQKEFNDCIEILLNDIGPVTLLKSQDKLLVFVHPSMNEQIQQFFGQRYFKLHKNEFSIFQLQGPLALYQIQKLLSNLSINETSLSEGGCSYYTGTFQNQKIQSNPNFTYKGMKSFDDYDDEFSQIQIQEKFIQHSYNQIWEQQPDLNKRFVTVTRSRHTHKSKQKLEYQKQLKEKKKQLILDRQQKKQKSEQKQIQLQDLTEDKPEEIDPSQMKKAIRWLLSERQANQSSELIQMQIEVETNQPDQFTLCIIKPCENQLSQFSQGFKVVAPSGQGLTIWKLFYQMKVKPIGLRDSRQLALENRVLFYPNDYINSVGYSELIKFQHIQKINDELRKPPAKRQNHSKLNYPTPFKPLWDLIQTKTQNVFVKAFAGVPEVNSIIVLPTQEDIEMFLKQQLKIPVMQNSEFISNTSKNQEEIIAYEQQLKTIKLDRRLIGYFTSASFSLKLCMGVGIASISTQVISQLGKTGFLLYRNPNSLYYYFAAYE